MLVWHFSRLILFMATRSCLGVQRAACTTAVAPLPGITTTTEQWQSRQERRGTRSRHSWTTTLYLNITRWALWPLSALFLLCFCVYTVIFIFPMKIKPRSSEVVLSKVHGILLAKCLRKIRSSREHMRSDCLSVDCENREGAHELICQQHTAVVLFLMRYDLSAHLHSTCTC